MKKGRRIVKKMSKKSLINKKALRYIIANSNLCKHAIRELELAGDCRQEREREINPPEYDTEVHVVREKDVF